MTNKNYKTRANRDGITLLFVISMVVLFLLMGTTFMLVSNDYFKSARSRADAVSYQVDSTALLDRCFYDLVRGPSLADVSSPLRGHSILADQYGYGIKAEVFAGPGPGAGTPPAQAISGPFVTISLSAAPPVPVFPPTIPPSNVAPALNTADAMRLVRNPTVALDPSTDATMIAATGSTYVDGLYAGRVLSITSGALTGFSSRIISHTFVPDATAANNRMTVVVLANGLNWAALANDDEVVINGADFSGRGAGDLTAFGGTLAALDVYDPDTIPAGGLGANSIQVNQQGVPLSADGMPLMMDDGTPFLLADGTPVVAINDDIEGYLASDQSTNESYDIPDHQNLFLGGVIVDANGVPTGIIPSFHRDAILMSATPGIAPGDMTDATNRANLLRQFSLRPIYVRDPSGQPIFGEVGFPASPAPGSTANFDFFEQSLPELLPGNNIDTVGPIAANGTLGGGFTANALANLDVDSDGDGVLDSVWIDIGLPAQTDSQGRTFKPLVAYRVVDMDGRINLNTSGTLVDLAAGAAAGLRGGGYGVAEITPRNFVTSYTDMLNERYQSTEFLDLATPPDAIPGVERDAGGNVLATGNHLGRNQKLIGYPGGAFIQNPDPDNPVPILGGGFGTGLDLFGQLQLGTVSATTLPEFSRPTTLPASAINPYQVNLGLSGSSLDNLFTPDELEGVLRANDADGALQPSRLRNLVAPAKRNGVTTHSFEITLPATTGSLVKKLNELLAAAGVATPAARTPLINGLLSQHVLLGGKVDINRALGNGIDDDGDGVVDNESLLATPVTEQTGQHDRPVLDLDQGGDGAVGDGAARQILAQDLYITALLVCGENAPPGLTLTSGNDVNLAYRRMVAQWAINIVDFRDPDSIMTAFPYDDTPFDGSPWTPSSVVWGAERPELLITETFAYHDRRNQDLGAGMGMLGTMAPDEDDDWDSGQVPQSGAFFELYHPWGEVNDITRSIPAELDINAVDGNGDPAPTGVNLGQATPNDDPVWRLAFKRARVDTSFARAVYFYNVDTTRTTALQADLTGGGDFFFTTLRTKTVLPGEHAVIGSSGNVGERTANSDRYETTFGRLNSSSVPLADGADIGRTRAITLDLVNDRVGRRDGIGGGDTFDEDGNGDPSNELVKTIVINSPRSLSISDPNNGYTAALTAAGASTSFSGDGQEILPVMDRPLDAGANTLDIDAIWTNGVTDNFRFAYLQRLANPLLDYNALTNPYLTIDTAGVDLLAFNGMSRNSDNGPTDEVYIDGGAARGVVDGGTVFKSVERGESKHDALINATVPKQNLFASEEGNRIDPGTDGTEVAGGTTPHNFGYAFTETFGGFNNSYTAFTNGGVGATTPLGWLTWNNRPFSSAAEVANVPFHSSQWLCYYFNQGTIDGTADPSVATNLKPTGVLADDDRDVYELMAFFGNTDQGHKHLLRFGQNNEVTADFGALPGHPAGTTITAATEATNRMVNIFDYIEVPNKFLGSETFLSIDGAGNSINGGAGFGFEVPFHGVPNFRAPGKININTINDTDVWDAIFGYTPAAPMDFATFNASRGTTSGPTDFGGVFTSSEGSQFVSEASNNPVGGGLNPEERAANAGGTLFQLSGPVVPGTRPVGAFDGRLSLSTAPIKDTFGSPYFTNEVRQRFSSMVTTRSSVFSIWITIGYFELDDFGRIGAELGSLEGQVTRNRAYYLYDRSIPVAFEPGKDHNVENGTLVRTIIQ